MILKSEDLDSEDIFYESQSQTDKPPVMKSEDNSFYQKRSKQIQLFPLLKKIPEDFQERYACKEELQIDFSRQFLNYQPSSKESSKDLSQSSSFCYDRFSESGFALGKDNSLISINKSQSFQAQGSKSARKARQTITEDKLQLLNVIFQIYLHNRYFMHSEQPQENIEGKKILKELILKRPDLSSLFDKIMSISSVTAITKIVNLAQSTILHKLKEFKERGQVKAGPRLLSKYVKQKYKKSFQIEKQIIQALSQRPFYSAIELTRFLSNKYNLSYSRCLINRHLKDMGFNLSMRQKSRKENTQELKEIRYKYVTSLQQYQQRIKLKNIFYVDECIFEKDKINLNKNRGMINQQEQGNGMWLKDNFVSVLVAMNQINVVYFMIQKGVIEKKDFYKAMMELKERTIFEIDQNQEQVIVLDLHPIHLPNQDNKKRFPFRRLYLPPNSSQLNPCLNLFSELKQQKTYLSNEISIDFLEKWVESRMVSISSKGVSKYFSGLSRMKSKALSLQNY